ncbi:hypothetical protein [Sinobaca sp. H24]|uniref:hypothetical protein n=1 Tax=Sinobaca sp. H24 TaxID=2923376 RepID=UPI0035ADD9BD
MQKITAGSILLTVVLALGACGNGQENENMMDEDMMDEETMEDNMSEQEMMGGDSEGHMNHSSSGEVPEDLQEAENPEFEEEKAAGPQLKQATWRAWKERKPLLKAHMIRPPMPSLIHRKMAEIL